MKTDVDNYTLEFRMKGVPSEWEKIYLHLCPGFVTLKSSKNAFRKYLSGKIVFNPFLTYHFETQRDSVTQIYQRKLAHENWSMKTNLI